MINKIVHTNELKSIHILSQCKSYTTFGRPKKGARGDHGLAKAQQTKPKRNKARILHVS